MPPSSPSIPFPDLTQHATVILAADEIERLLDLETCIAAVECAFIAHAEGRVFGPAVLGVHAPGGGFHVKAAGMAGPFPRFVAKLNANFPQNRERFGMPTIQGVAVLSDAGNGFPLAIMDSAAITILRTAAATGLAARTLARADAGIVTVCGCGAQSKAQLRALALVRPLEKAFAYDLDFGRATAFADEMTRALAIPISVAENLGAATRQSDMVVTCTPSRRFFLEQDMVRPGTFIAAVGADSEDKQEISPDLMGSAKVVTDIRDQCTTIGDLHHAIAAETMRAEDVHAEIADVLIGRRPGRENEDEITIFDSTGTAIEDVAAAVAVHERALAADAGLRVRFGAET